MDPHAADTGNPSPADELTEVLLDRLAPALDTYRREVARRAGLGLDGLVCVERLRRRHRLAASSLGAALVVTRSGLSKILRRLEADGQIERHRPEGPGREVEVVWRPLPRRDAVFDELRDRFRRDLEDLALTYRLDDPERRALVGWLMVQVADMVARHTRELADAAEYTRFLERRRRGRAAAPDPWRDR